VVSLVDVLVGIVHYNKIPRVRRLTRNDGDLLINTLLVCNMHGPAIPGTYDTMKCTRVLELGTSYFGHECPVCATSVQNHLSEASKALSCLAHVIHQVQLVYRLYSKH